MDAAGDDDLALVKACLEIEDELRQRVEAAIGEPVRYTVATSVVKKMSLFRSRTPSSSTTNEANVFKSTSCELSVVVSFDLTGTAAGSRAGALLLCRHPLIEGA